MWSSYLQAGPVGMFVDAGPKISTETHGIVLSTIDNNKLIDCMYVCQRGIVT